VNLKVGIIVSEEHAVSIIRPEYQGSMFLRNVHTAKQPGKSQFFSEEDGDSMFLRSVHTESQL
jgi:hypothetical protein